MRFILCADYASANSMSCFLGQMLFYKIVSDCGTSFLPCDKWQIALKAACEFS